MDQSPPSPAYHVAIRPHAGWLDLGLKELWQSRDLVFTLGTRDIKVRYKQTALGAVWIVFQPLLAAGILSFVFGRVAGLKTPGGVPTFLFTFVGFLIWNVFSKTLSRTSGCMVSNQQLVSKVYFPRLALPLSGILATLVDFTAILLLLVPMLLMSWHLPGLSILLMPVCLFFVLVLAVGIGLFSTSIGVRYRDVEQIIPVLTQLLMWGTPVPYALAYISDNPKIPELLRTIYLLNPLATLVEAFRWSVLGVGDFRYDYFAYSAGISVAIFVAGALFFRRMERNFADVI